MTTTNMTAGGEEETADRRMSNKSAIGDLTTYWAHCRQLYEPINGNKPQRGRWGWWWSVMMEEEEEEEGWDEIKGIVKF